MVFAETILRFPKPSGKLWVCITSLALTDSIIQKEKKKICMQDNIRQLSKTIHQINGLYHKEIHQMDLNLYETRVLYALYIDKLKTQKEISEQYEMPKQTINNFITALHKQGFIEITADERDHRQKILALTDAGKDYAHRTLSPLLKFEEDVVAKIDPEKFALLLDALMDYSAALEAVRKERRSDS